MERGLPKNTNVTFASYFLLARQHIDGDDHWHFLDKKGYDEYIPSVEEWVCDLDENGARWQRGWKDEPCEFVVVAEYETRVRVLHTIDHVASASW